MKKINGSITLTVVLSAILSVSALAGGQSTAAIPTKVEVTGDGFMIYGNFGNANNCVASDKLFVRNDHPQYKFLYATALEAFSVKQKITAYVNECQDVSWYAAPSTTFNTITSYYSLAIQE